MNGNIELEIWKFTEYKNIKWKLDLIEEIYKKTFDMMTLLTIFHCK